MLLNNRTVFPDPLDWLTSPSELVTNFWYPPKPPAVSSIPEWKANKDGAALEIEVPGFGRGDLLVDLSGHRIKIESHCDRPFSLKLALPKQLDPETLVGILKDGLLVLRASFLAPHSRSIPIQTEDHASIRKEKKKEKVPCSD